MSSTTPHVNPNGAGPIKVVHGQPVQGRAVADAAELKARVDVDGEDGLALRGYDTVSYHVQGKPLKGLEDWQVYTENVLQGRVRYRFATKENAELFKNSHCATYKPQFGGFCAMGEVKGTRRRRIRGETQRAHRWEKLRHPSVVKPRRSYKLHIPNNFLVFFWFFWFFFLLLLVPKTARRRNGVRPELTRWPKVSCSTATRWCGWSAQSPRSCTSFAVGWFCWNEP